MHAVIFHPPIQQPGSPHLLSGSEMLVLGLTPQLMYVLPLGLGTVMSVYAKLGHVLASLVCSPIQ